jgi:hypothetical protein
MGTVGDLKIRKLTSLGGLATDGDLTTKLIAANAQLKAATGVDIMRAIDQRGTPPQDASKR